jgi:putative PIN family toxin of toxin-antitoxin system
MRAVFDTVVFVRALINPHSACGRIVFEAARYQLFLSEPVLVEILEVLRRPELTRKFRALQDLDLRRVLDILGRAAVVRVPSIPAVSRDPKDDKFLATALAARADYLVSEDRDLLDLEAYDGTTIFTCEEFLAILELSAIDLELF